MSNDSNQRTAAQDVKAILDNFGFVDYVAASTRKRPNRAIITGNETVLSNISRCLVSIGLIVTGDPHKGALFAWRHDAAR